jgi:hypothetical protein
MDQVVPPEEDGTKNYSQKNTLKINALVQSGFGKKTPSNHGVVKMHSCILS